MASMLGRCFGKYVISGSLVVSDSNGRRFTCRVGDIFYIPKGATITFETEEGGKAKVVARGTVDGKKRDEVAGVFEPSA